MRELLPAAEGLAAALRSAKARNLLMKVQESVWELEREEPKVMSRKGLGRPLEDALAALRELHQAAIERVEAMAQDAAFLPPFPVLGPWAEGAEPDTISDIEQGLERETVRACLVSLRSIHQSTKSLSQRFTEVQRRLSAEQFADERDG